MFVIAQAPDTPAPPPPPIEEKRAPAPPKLVAPTPPSQWTFPRGLSLVTGLGNPEWAHIGVAYRYEHLGGAFNVGTQGLAHNLGLTLRYFVSPDPGGLFVEAGATAVQLAEVTPGLTPRDIFFQRFLGLGWQFTFSHIVVNLGAGLHDPPDRSTAPPAAIVSSSLLPRFLGEVGYAF